MNKESIKERLNEHIRFVSEILEELDRPEESRSDFSVSDSFCYYNVSDLCGRTEYEPISKLYIPKATYVQKPKCNKCSDTREIEVEDGFNRHTKLCDCFYSLPEYSVQELNVFNQNALTLVAVPKIPLGAYGIPDSITVMRENVLNSFEESQLALSKELVVYDNKESCEEYCNRRNSSNGST